MGTRDFFTLLSQLLYTLRIAASIVSAVGSLRSKLPFLNGRVISTTGRFHPAGSIRHRKVSGSECFQTSLLTLSPSVPLSGY